MAPAMDGNELILRGMLLRDVDEAWRHIIVAFSPRVVYELACEASARGAELPGVVEDFLDREGLALKPAKHRD